MTELLPLPSPSSGSAVRWRATSQVTSPQPLRLFNPLVVGPSAVLSPSVSPFLPAAFLSRTAPASPPTPQLPSPPLLHLSLGFARCAVEAVSAMGSACGKAALDSPPPTSTISHYFSAHNPVTHSPHASAHQPAASPPAASTATVSGITIYPIYETSSPIVSRRVDMSGFRVKTSFDAGSAASEVEGSNDSTDGVDTIMLREQLQVLSRLKSHSKSGKQSAADTDGTVVPVSRTESPSGSSEVKVA